MQLTRRIEQAIGSGVVRADLGSPLAVAQALWASIHGLVAIQIARPAPHFPWEPMEALVHAQTEMLLNGLLTDALRA